MRVFACLCCVAWLIALPALAQVELAQVELVDPDAAPRVRPAPKKTQPPKAAAKPSIYADDEDDAEDSETPADDEREDDEPDGEQPGQRRRPRPEPTLRREAPAAPLPAPKVEPVKAAVPQVEVRSVTDADLLSLWNRWKEANGRRDAQAELAARKDLLAMKEQLGAPDMELWALGMLRAAHAHTDAGDDGAALEIALGASQLAPDLPAVWFALSRLYLRADPSGVGRYSEALLKGLTLQWKDPRYRRPALINVLSVLMLAWVATAIVVVAVLLFRRARYFFFDLHFFFPKSASRWQTTVLGVLLLGLPLILRWGIAPTLLVWFAAVTWYLQPRERIVAGALIASLGALPSLAWLAVEHGAFAETPAEDLYRINRLGSGLEPLVRRYEQLSAEDKVGAPHRVSLGLYHLSRGVPEQAIAYLRGALKLSPDDVTARLGLAKALFLTGDLENSRSILDKLKDEALPAKVGALVLFDLARVHQRRAQVFGDSGAGEVGKAGQFLARARQLDPTIPALSFDEPLPEKLDGNTYLKVLPLEPSRMVELIRAEAAATPVAAQLSRIVLGDVSLSVGLAYPALVAALLIGVGFLGTRLDVSRECNRCGRPVSRRGDPELSPGSPMCTQCVNVFARKNVVAPSVKVRKQLEIARYDSQLERAKTVLGVLFSGTGHVFSGRPVAGALYTFLFSAGLAGLLLRTGAMRPPYEGLPMPIRVAPLALLLMTVYLWSLLRLRRKVV